MLNHCSFIGNLGRDPEVKILSSGARVVSFSLAVSERWKDKNGERQEKTTWVPIVIWNDGLGRVAESYLRKGSKVYVSGALQIRKYTAQDMTERYATEVVLGKFRGELVLLDGRLDGGGDPAPGRKTPDGLDDEIPF